MVQPLWKPVWGFLKKLKMELLYDPAVPLLYIYPEELKQDLKEIFAHPCLMSFAVLFTTAKRQKQTKCLSGDDQIKKMW